MSKKISDLTAATTPLAGTEVVEIVQSGASKKVAVSYLGGSSGWREALSSDRTYYVRTDGSDSNTGLSNTSGGAFLTIQKAFDVICLTLDLRGYSVTVQLADGTYTSGGLTKSLVGGGGFSIKGNNTTPSNVVISTTSNNCFSSQAFGVELSVQDMKLQTTASGSCLQASGGGSILFQNINFGSAATSHIYLRGTGSNITATGNYTISGDSPVHAYVLDLSLFAFENKTITLSGTRAFSTAYLFGRLASGISCGGTTFSGSATGKRYDLSLNSAAYATGVTLPGNVAGTTATGAQYA